MDTRVWKWILAGASGMAALAFLYLFPPDQVSFYPRCLLFTFTGLACPGCGGLRALHHVLHGELALAFRLNPLVIISLPVAAGMAAVCFLKLVPPERLLKPVWLWALLGVGILFSVARNLPAFAVLKP